MWPMNRLKTRLARTRRPVSAKPWVEGLDRRLVLSGFDGIWQGTITQGSSSNQTTYDYVMDLTENQGQVQGYTRIETADLKFFGVMPITGSVSGSTLTFQEQTAVIQLGSLLAGGGSTGWLVKSGTLQLAANGSSSTGTWSAPGSGGTPSSNSGSISLTSAPSLSPSMIGSWQGSLTNPNSFLTTNYSFDLEVTQQNQKLIQGVEGITEISDNAYSATINFTGIIVGTEFFFKDGTITNSDLPSYLSWATKVGRLEFSADTKSLSGTWGGLSGFGTGGSIDLTLSQKSTPTPTSTPTSTSTPISTPTATNKPKRTPPTTPAPAPPPRRLSAHPATPPRVIGVKETIGRRGAQTLVLKLDQAVLARSTHAKSSYLLRSPGADGVLGTADDTAVPISLARYNARAHTISLVVSQHPRPSGTMQLIVNASGIVNPLGQKLDGKGDGTPGSEFISTLTLR